MTTALTIILAYFLVGVIHAEREMMDLAREARNDPQTGAKRMSGYEELTASEEVANTDVVHIRARGMLPDVRKSLVEAILRQKVFEKEYKEAQNITWYRVTLAGINFEDYCTSDEDFATSLANALLKSEFAGGKARTNVRRTSDPNEQRLSAGVTFLRKRE